MRPPSPSCRPSKFPHRLAAVISAAWLLLWPAAAPGADNAAPQKPNIVLVLTDDMGFSDIASYGGEIPTPNLDRLAKEGMRFTQFYNAARCCPTRGALLTGNYNHAVGMPGMEGPGSNYDPTTGQRVGPVVGGAILREAPTLGEILRHNGYQTFLAGKWHVGEKREDQWPLQRGFDKFYGPVKGAVPNKFNGANIYEGNEEIPKPVPAGWYTGNVFADKSLEWIRGRDRSKPFFLFFSSLEPHWPWAAPDEDVAPFRGKYDAGYEALRAARHRRAIELGIIPPGTELPPLDPGVPSWDEMSKRPEAAKVIAMAEQHAGMIANLDKNLGRIIEELEKEGQLDNTIFLFLSDNGAEIPSNSDGGKSYAWIWHPMANAPFRFQKHYAHEGGIATPFIVRWPAGRVPAGKINTGQVGHVMDIVPTLLEAIDGTFPEKNLGLDTIKPAGQSLLAAFRDPGVAERRTLFWEHGGNEGVRDGQWKLVRPLNTDFVNPSVTKDAKEAARTARTGEWELYDLEADRTEMNNLAAKMPEKVAELEAKLQAWAKGIGLKLR